MKSNVARIALAATLIALAAPALAQKASPPSPPSSPTPPVVPAVPAVPKPAVELAAFESNAAGTWDCSGKGKNPDGSEFSVEGAYTIKRAASGLGMTIEFAGKELKGAPPAYQAAEVVHWDPATKKLVRRTIDSFGAASTLTSPGEEKGEWIFSGSFDAPGMGRMENRDHFAKPANGTMRIWSELLPPGSKGWLKVVDMTCKKR